MDATAAQLISARMDGFDQRMSDFEGRVDQRLEASAKTRVAHTRAILRAIREQGEAIHGRLAPLERAHLEGKIRADERGRWGQAWAAILGALVSHRAAIVGAVMFLGGWAGFALAAPAHPVEGLRGRLDDSATVVRIPPG